MIQKPFVNFAVPNSINDYSTGLQAVQDVFQQAVEANL
jgi:hypothetical protein